MYPQDLQYWRNKNNINTLCLEKKNNNKRKKKKKKKALSGIMVSFIHFREVQCLARSYQNFFKLKTF